MRDAIPCDMQVKNVMSQRTETIRPEDTIERAATWMRDLNLGVLPVCHADRLVGVLTDRDIIVRVMARGLDPSKTVVRQAMTPKVFYCFEDQDIEEVARIMAQHFVRRLLVMDESLRFTGIVSMDDVERVLGRAWLRGVFAQRAAGP
ncbi:MAG: CBS domain-containing protein [Deltaproteobacteria bacterium]|nr:CBS domain-containing protein [Deltaproteobacteria bacterium]